ncbi:hypothetical protein FHS61_000608 [Altererythrobacter atlanticus]|nr:O-antigen ligase family protein [Croceibacterium atlanticum]MBB5731615.1 hypothetical protein [Croceibacterium atlanticum]
MNTNSATVRPASLAYAAPGGGRVRRSAPSGGKPADTGAPHPLAAALMTIGAFLVGYQAFRLGGVNLTFSDVFFAMAFGVCLAQGQITARPFGSMTPFWLAALAMMLTGLMIGTVINGDMIRWVVIALQYLFGFLFFPVMLMGQPVSLARRLVCTFILGMVIMEIIGISVALTMTHAEASQIFPKEFLAGNGRMSSFATEPNWNGELIAFTGPLTLYALAKRMIPLWAFIIAIGILLWGLLLSASFTGFAAFTIGMTICLLFVGIRKLVGVSALVAVGAVIFVASGAPLPSIFQERVGGALTEGSLQNAGTYEGRVELIGQAWDTANDTLIVGLGVEGFRKTNDIKQPVHNLPMLMLVDGGLLSFCGFVMLVALMFIMPLRKMGTNRLEAGAVFAVATVFIIYTQALPHMFSRLNIVPPMLALMLLYARPDGLIRRS